MRRPALRLGLALVFTVACLGWLLASLDRATLGAQIQNVRPGWLAAAIGLSLLLPFWRAARLRGLLAADAAPATGTCWRIVAETLLWAILLPFKLGELSFPVLLARRLQLTPAAATGLFLLVRLADLAVIAGALLLGLAVGTILHDAPGLRSVAAAIAAALLLGPYALVALTGFLGSRTLAWHPAVAAAVAAAAHARSTGARLRLTLTSWGLWATHAGVVGCAIAASGAAVGIGDLLVTSAAGNLAFALPVSGILGLGPQQVAVATSLELAGTPWPIAVTAALTTYVSSLAGAVLCGVTAWLCSALSHVGHHKSKPDKGLPQHKQNR